MLIVAIKIYENYFFRLIILIGPGFAIPPLSVRPLFGPIRRSIYVLDLLVYCSVKSDKIHDPDVVEPQDILKNVTSQDGFV